MSGNEPKSTCNKARHPNPGGEARTRAHKKVHLARQAKLQARALARVHGRDQVRSTAAWLDRSLMAAENVYPLR
jgi:hypothetical protein